MCAQVVDGNQPGLGGPPNNWLSTLRDGLAVVQSTEGATEDSPRQFGVETVLCVHAAKKTGKWYRVILGAAERFMARWHVNKEKMSSERRAARMRGVQSRTDGGGIGKPLLKKARVRRQTW